MPVQVYSIRHRYVYYMCMSSTEIYAFNTMYLYTVLSLPGAMAASAAIFVPFFYRLGLTSTFQVRRGRQACWHTSRQSGKQTDRQAGGQASRYSGM